MLLILREAGLLRESSAKWGKNRRAWRRLGRREAKSLPAWKVRMAPFYLLVIKTQENNEIVVSNSVMASQAII